MRIDGSKILTHTGRYVDPLALRPEDIDIEDIAHALSNQCRFSGHTRNFYSVAEHSVRCAWTVADMDGDEREQLHALLHDAQEAYLVDMPRPLKEGAGFGRLYREAEERAQKIILNHFGVSLAFTDMTHAADLILLATERRDLMPTGGEWEILDGIDPLPTKIQPTSPIGAKAEFLTLFDRLLQKPQIAGNLAA